MNHLGTRRLETNRLILRPFTEADAEAIYRNWASDDEVTKYLTWPTHGSVEASKAYTGYCIQNYSNPQFYNWGIEWKETGEVIGNISVVNCVEEIVALELGWALGRKYWGRAIMPEAAAEVIRYLFEQVGAGRVSAGHDVNNPKSGRVMQKVGMKYEGTIRGAGRNNQGIVDMAIYGLLRSDYELMKKVQANDAETDRFKTGKSEVTLVSEAKHFISELFLGEAGGHDPQHSLRVFNNALAIAESYPDCDRLVVALAALLHDADDHKLFPTENNANTRSFLKKEKVPDETIEKIILAINSVSFSKNKGSKPETLEGMIVQDADRLDAMGAVGVARTFAYGGAHGRPMEDSLKHFDEKLLLLKDLMNTDAAKLMAKDRHTFLERFKAKYLEETK